MKRISTNPAFWAVIQDIQWAKHLDDREAKRRLTTACQKHSLSVKECEAEFLKTFKTINEETLKRVKKGTDVGSFDGADDTHFMDMPAHLIGLGKAAVEDYLEGGMIEFQPVECLKYMFQK